jgi:SAM-dependent methyltransferase
MQPFFRYGLDAPPVVAVFGAASLVCFALAFLGLPAWIPVQVTGWIYPAIGFGSTSLGMMWESGVGKLRIREKLLDRLSWAGGERVLDVGCGQGLMAVAAARRVPAGRVDGIDLWAGRDLSGNSAEAVLRNARAEGVEARVFVQTGDMRALPFPDASFDRVVSRYAIHNISSAAGRDEAIEEIARVLAPGGEVLIDDIGHVGRYAALLRKAGLEVSVERRLWDVFRGVSSFGFIWPARLVGKRGTLQP